MNSTPSEILTLEPPVRCRPSGPRRRSVSSVRACAIALLLPLLTPACLSSQTNPRPEKWAQRVPSTTLKNWYMVTPDVYRSEQPSRKGFEEIRAQGIRSIVNLRSNHSDAKLTEGLDFNLISVPMTAGGFSEEDIVKALKAIRDAPKPVLVHCQYGADRAGVVMAMYRIVFQDWSKEDALAELKGGGYKFHFYYFNIPSFVNNADVARLKAWLDAH